MTEERTVTVRLSDDEWRAHFEALKGFEGTQAEYCELYGLKISSFTKKKSKLGYSGNPRIRRSRAQLQNTFAKIQVVESSTPASKVYDPVWVARFLREFCR